MKILILFFIVVGLTTPAQAHRLSVFAYAEQGRLRVESFFSGNRPARNCPVVLTAPDTEKILAQGKTDEQGKATLDLVGNGTDIQVTVNCGDGHRGQWLYQGDSGAEIEPTVSVSSPITGQITPALAGPQSAEQLRQIIAQELDKQLGPLRRQLALNSERQPSLPDILGGIGYLLGLAGLVSYLRNRRR